jgi:hypothetical protein
MGFAALYPSYALRTSSHARRHTPASSRRISPELCSLHRPHQKGRREDRVPAGTHGPLCAGSAKGIAQRHTGEAQHTAFPAQWLYGLCRALPGERCTIAPVALRILMHMPGWAPTSPQRLAHRPRAPGPHDFAVRRSHRSCARHPRSRLPALRSRSRRCYQRPPPSGPRS